MKIKRLIIKNIGLIGSLDLPINKPLILFYGDLLQGKSTILNAFKWSLGGAFPSDIIQHGKVEASVTSEFENGSISREWYRSKDGSVRAREIKMVVDGKLQKRPADEIKKFLNPFLLDQDYLRRMGEADRKAYFTQLFDVDTSELDTESTRCEVEARDLRAKIKGYGDIDLKEVETVDPMPLQRELVAIRAHYQARCNDITAKNKLVIEHNAKATQAKDAFVALCKEIKSLEEKLIDLRSRKVNMERWCADNPHKEETTRPEPPDTSALESKISEAAATNVRAEQYQKNLERYRARQEDEKKLSELESRQKEIKREKIARLATIDTRGIKDLVFDESGNFTYQGTQAGMLSTSQIMDLTSALTALYPCGFGLELIDRAESLGKSIFGFIDRAEREQKSILAAIVGEKPAKVPDHVGVFVVENGEVK